MNLGYKLCDADTLRSLVVIHYGNNRYDSNMFRAVVNCYKTKPIGGFWVSPIDSNFGWKDFCLSYDNPFINFDEDVNFKLAFRANSRVLLIDSLDDAVNFFNTFSLNGIIDFVGVSKACDAIWLTENGYDETKFSFPILMTEWCCESILILNKDSCYELV